VAIGEKKGGRFLGTDVLQRLRFRLESDEFHELVVFFAGGHDDEVSPLGIKC
jgi:hypothetical protein